MQHRALGDGDAAILEILDRLARHPSDRRAHPHDLGRRRHVERGIGGQRLPLPGMVREHRHAEAQLVARGVDAGEGQHQREVPQFLVAQPVALFARLHHDRQDVLARIGLARFQHLADVVAKLHRRRLDLGDEVGEVHPQRQPHRGRGAQDEGRLALGQAEQQAEHPRGIGIGELGHEIAAALVDEPVRQIVGDAFELGHQRLDHLRRKRRVHELAQAPVIVALGDQDRLVPPVRKHALGHPVQRRPGMAALDQRLVGEQLAHLLMAQHRKPVRRAGIPALCAGLPHRLGPEREGRVRDVEKGRVGKLGLEAHGRHSM